MALRNAAPVAALTPPKNSEGDPRTVGVELEFSGLTAERAAEIVAASLGGRIERRHSRRFDVHAAQGLFAVELDSRWADPDFVEANAGDLPDDLRAALRRGVETVGVAVLDRIFPVELVCPPIPHPDLGLLRAVAADLADAGAIGTRHSAFSGFGLHFNVQIAASTVEHLLSVMRAYAILSFELRRDSRLALVRQAQHYIEPFSEAYKRHILAANYAPDLARFMDDHMRFNPTRNMELDLLPVFAHLDSERVAAALPGEKNSPRPTFHWRLPNCRIDEPDWEPGQDWSRWTQVEALAADAARLETLAARYLVDGPTSEFVARMRRLTDSIG